MQQNATVPATANGARAVPPPPPPPPRCADTSRASGPGIPAASGDGSGGGAAGGGLAEGPTAQLVRAAAGCGGSALCADLPGFLGTAATAGWERPARRWVEAARRAAGFLAERAASQRQVQTAGPGGSGGTGVAKRDGRGCVVGGARGGSAAMGDGRSADSAVRIGVAAGAERTGPTTVLDLRRHHHRCVPVPAADLLRSCCLC